MKADEYLSGKKVLVMGLGFVSAGATVRWLCEHGARVTVTDLWPRGTPDAAIAALGSVADTIELVIGEYRREDFTSCDILVVNPSISFGDEHVALARKHGARIENELSLFMRFCPGPVIGVTGTRGKTTTATWAHHFVTAEHSSAVLAGNMGDTPLLSIVDTLSGDTPVVAELSSFQLEALPEVERAADVAVVTNIMRDHLNRYGTMEEYVDAKANVFLNQTEKDALVLKKNDKWTEYFLQKNPHSRVVFYDDEELGFELPGDFEEMWGAHNIQNLRAAAHAAHALGVSWESMHTRVGSLPHPAFRQEVIHQEGRLIVVNDTTATTPDAAIAGINTFKKKGTLILVGGGADKNLDFDIWAEVVQNVIAPKHLLLLEGSATDKMLGALAPSFKESVLVFNSLEECVRKALTLADTMDGTAVILFSPGATSFGMFQNEFDRGRQFTGLIREYTPKGE